MMGSNAAAWLDFECGVSLVDDARSEREWAEPDQSRSLRDDRNSVRVALSLLGS